MPTAVTMPRLGLSMVEGTVVEWRALPGETVEKGRTILVIESEKAEVEIEAFASGVLAAVYVDPGATVPIGTLLGAIVEPGEVFDARAYAEAFVPEREGAPATIPGAPSEAPERPAAPRTESAGIKIAPAARALARRLGIEVDTIEGTGPGGRILPEDVQRAAAGSVAVNGTRLSLSIGGSGPPLLLVSGFAVDASGWRRQAEALARDFTVIAYDHRGIGRSAPTGHEPLSLATLADDAGAVLVHTGHTPAVVVGASMGAAIAIELALRRPEIVRGLALISPVLRPDPRFEAALRSWAGIEDPAARVNAMLPWLLGRAALRDAGRREAAAAALRVMARTAPPATLRQHLTALLGWLGTREKDLGSTTPPALVFVGAEDLLTPPEQAEAVASRLPNAELVRFADAAHALLIERAEDVSNRIREFAAGLA